MSLPGFTAETSLYETKKHYQDAASFPRPNKAIYPAFADWLGGWAWEEGSLDPEPGPRTFGLVKGEIMEDRFNACLNRCRAGAWHPTAAACQRTCCQEVTGFQSCYVA
jgi:hypothetical protein